jgi:hypothetical protein
VSCPGGNCKDLGPGLADKSKAGASKADPPKADPAKGGGKK